MELGALRIYGVDAVRAQLHDEDDGAPFDPSLLEGLDDAQAEALLLGSLEAIGVNLQFGTRPSEAIVRRLVRKLRRDDPRARIDRALGLLGRLCLLQGPADVVLPQAAALLREHDLPTSGLDELRAVLDLVQAHGVPASQISVDFGLGRGLHYYTGLIFEIYDADGVQLCGGGRYDDLVTALGGRQLTPAVGFAYGLERVVAARRLVPVEQRAAREVLVVAADEDSYPYALRVAQTLRAGGYVAAVDVRGRSVASNVRDAMRRGVICAIVGAQEAARDELLWRDPARREEQRLALGDVPVPA